MFISLFKNVFLSSELHNFLRERNGMANISKIEFGYKLLEGSKKIMNNIITICEFNEINLYQQYKKQQSEIDPYFCKINEFNKQKNKLNIELGVIQKTENEIMTKIKQKIRIKKYKNERIYY